MLYRISHPNGAPQSYSEHKVDNRATTCRSWPRGPWIYSRDSFGATQGGSSGSPVLNGEGATGLSWASSPGAVTPDTVTVVNLTSTAECTGRGGRWTANVDIGISPALTSATVSGNWDDSAKGSGSCITDFEGNCRVSKKNLKSGGIATFTVTNIDYPEHTFVLSGPDDSQEVTYPVCQ